MKPNTLLFVGLLILPLLFFCNPASTGSDSGSSETITDIDGNVYHTVTIGSQTWTLENLRTTKYNDGIAIPIITDSVSWYNRSTPAYCYPNNTTNVTTIKKYGALYNWYTVQTGKLAPSGWHVPTSAEWNTLLNYLIANGYNYDETTTGEKIAKSLAAKTDWGTDTAIGSIGNNLSKNNKSGFSAFPAGFRCNDGYFVTPGRDADWWSTSGGTYTDPVWGYTTSCAHTCNLSSSDNDVGLGYEDLSCGMSVRLIKD